MKKKEFQLKFVAGHNDTTITVALSPEEKTLQQVTVILTRSNNHIRDEPQRIDMFG